jgi:GTP-binding protein
METRNERVFMEFKIPSRGLIGLRGILMTLSAGEAVIAHRFIGYEPYKGDIEKRVNGSMIAIETGTAVAYGMDKLKDRGRFFIEPGEQVYAGQVVGESNKEGDLVVNVNKTRS